MFRVGKEEQVVSVARVPQDEADTEGESDIDNINEDAALQVQVEDNILS